MRQVILDTETTGLQADSGHRIIEIGCIEVKDRLQTDRSLHYYLNPEREIALDAIEVHGITSEQLLGEPVFADVANAFLEFVRDSELVIHNAPFDVSFINAELARLGKEWGKLEDYCRVIDTLELARELHPGQKNSLDALCQRYQVDNSNRDIHGALLDAELLLRVYLAMTGGQSSLLPDEEENRGAGPALLQTGAAIRQGALKVLDPTPEELVAHQRIMERLGSDA